MKKMEQKILKDGRVLPGGVLNVGGFLNQCIDTAFLGEIGEDVAGMYKDEKITKVLTIESSGIGFAVMIGAALGVPVVFAKKSRSSNVSGDVYTAWVRSFTHGRDNHIIVSKEHIQPHDRILIADDFLAHGSALNGLIAICEDAGAEVVGCVAAIEKGFQNGGDNLRARGYRVDSLAIIDEMSDESIVFRGASEELL